MKFLGLLVVIGASLMLVLVIRGAWGIFSAVNSFFLRRLRVGQIDGVFVCDPLVADPAMSRFLQPTIEAMKLIQQRDPRRYHRVCRYLKYIVNRPLISGGNFEQAGLVCNVDYDKYFAEGPDTYRLRMYACLLVHEATHGLLAAKRISYDDARWERSERLCRLEEYRFIRRVDELWADEYLNPKQFNPEFWQRYRNPEARRSDWAKRWREYREESLKKKRENDREKRYEELRRKGRRLF